MVLAAKIADEAWSDVQPSVSFLVSKASFLVSAMEKGKNAPTEWLSSAISGIAAYPQAVAMDESRQTILSLLGLVRSLQKNGSWAETVHGGDPSITQTARMISSACRISELSRVADDFGIETLDDDDQIVLRACIVEGVQYLLDLRERGSGWRMRSDSTGTLSYGVTAEVLLALSAADQEIAAGRRGGANVFVVGSTNAEEPENLTLAAVIYESSWWLAHNHASWAGSFESDVDSAVEPWSRLTYATAFEATLLAQSGGALALGAQHLDSLWLGAPTMWGEWDGNVAMPTPRGTVAAIRAFESLRRSLVREATGELMPLPAEYEPSTEYVTSGSIEIPQGRKAIELVFNGESARFTLTSDLVSVLEAVIAAGAFGATYASIEMTTKVPSKYLSTYIARINDAAKIATLYRLNGLLVKLPGRKPATWRLSPLIEGIRDERRAGGR